jgi:hypothetical protein
MQHTKNEIPRRLNGPPRKPLESIFIIILKNLKNVETELLHFTEI